MGDNGEVEHETSTKWTGGVQANVWWPVSAGVEHTRIKRWKDRGKRFGRDVREQSGLSDEQIAAKLEQHDEFAEAVQDAGEKAVRTPDEEFRTLLAHLVAGGLNDDARVDTSVYLINVFKTLQPFDLRVLAAYGRGVAVMADIHTDPVARKVVGVDVVHSLLRRDDYALVLASSMRLYAVGLLTNVVEGNLPVWTMKPEQPQELPNFGGYGLTPLAERLLAEIVEYNVVRTDVTEAEIRVVVSDPPE